MQPIFRPEETECNKLFLRRDIPKSGKFVTFFYDYAPLSLFTRTNLTSKFAGMSFGSTGQRTTLVSRVSGSKNSFRRSARTEIRFQIFSCTRQDKKSSFPPAGPTPLGRLGQLISTPRAILEGFPSSKLWGAR